MVNLPPARLLPALKAGEAEAYRLRPVTEADLPFICQVDAHAAQRLLVVCVRDAALWRYEIFGKSAQNLTRLEWRIIETADGEPVGYVGHDFKLNEHSALQMPVCDQISLWTGCMSKDLRILRTNVWR
jgi:hypothetical protein